MKQPFKNVFEPRKENLLKTKLGTVEKLNEQQELVDKSEVGELKSRMKALMNKLQTAKKEKEQLQKDNQTLQQEIMQMQTQFRCMVPGFANTGSTFPMCNELINQVAEFYKCECFDMFFDVLCPELNLKGIIFYFKVSLERIHNVIDAHFGPTFQAIKETGFLDTIDGPILNVLRKSFQNTHKQIEAKLTPNLKPVRDEIQKHLKLGDDQNLINPYLGIIAQLIEEKLCILVLSCFISDPPLHLDFSTIGTIVQFNQAKHDPIDGFIKNKEECIILMPSLMKNEEQVGKALVVASNYEIN